METFGIFSGSRRYNREALFGSTFTDYEQFELSIGGPTFVNRIEKVCDHLVSLCKDKVPVPNSLSAAVPSLFRTGRHSVFRNEETSYLKFWRFEDLVASKNALPLPIPRGLKNRANVWYLNKARPCVGMPLPAPHYAKDVVRRFHLQKEIFGHLSSVPTLASDCTGRYFVTGGDDGLVKVWNVESGRLLYTFRGLRTNISDLGIDQDNVLLAVGTERVVRVWSLQDGRPIDVLFGHEGVVQRLGFVPFFDENSRFLCSISNYADICFWKWQLNSQCFEAEPFKFDLATSISNRQMAVTCSSGGQFVAVTATDCAITIFCLRGGTPSLCQQVDPQTSFKQSVGWSNRGIRLLACGRSGLAYVFRYERKKWKPYLLDVKQSLPEDPPVRHADTKPSRIRIREVIWNCDDTMVIALCSDNRIRIFDSRLCKLLRYLNGTTNADSLVAHPFDPDVIMTYGGDDLIVVWNITEGNVLFKSSLHGSEPHRAIIRAALFAPDGTRICATTNLGRLRIFGIGDLIAPGPSEQFFHTDFVGLVQNEEGVSVDEEWQRPPHLVEPPFLVNNDGRLYPTSIQRFVPGRENCPEHLLVPDFPMRRIPLHDSDDFVLVYVPNLLRGDTAENGEQRLPCCWLSRHIVPPLEKEACEFYRAKVCASAEEELAFFDLESSKEPLPEVPTVGRRRNLNQSIYSMSAVSQQPGDLTGDSDDEYDPDYTNPSITNVSARRRVRTRRANASASDTNDQEDDEDDNDASSITWQAETESEDELSSSAESFSSVVSTTSPVNRRRRRQPVTNTRRRMEIAPSTPTEPSSQPLDLRGFSDWITCTSNRSFPYFPQKGDEVVYFHQGHRLYVQAVRSGNLYRIREREMPWRQVELTEEEFAVVQDVAFEIQEVRLCRLTLARIDRQTSLSMNSQFVVCFHDMPNVVDFIVLRQYYEISLRRRWRPNERFQTLIDDSWWIGTVVRREPFDSDCPHSNFQCLVIAWENGEEERLSPWDMQPACVNPAELSRHVPMWKYRPKSFEWPIRGIDAESDRIILGVDQLMGYPFAEPFLAPVDINEYPLYASVIDYPCDLNTIKLRLQNRFYRRLESVKSDVNYICKNARTFNLPGSSIVERADLVTKILIKYIDSQNCHDIASIYEEYRDDRPGPSNRSTTSDGDTPADWRQQCLDIMANLHQDVPGSEERLKGIERKLRGEQYETPVAFASEMTLKITKLQQDRRSQVRLIGTCLGTQFQASIESVIGDWQRARSTDSAPAYNTRGANGLQRRMLDLSSDDDSLPGSRSAGRRAPRRSGRTNGNLDETIDNDYSLAGSEAQQSTTNYNVSLRSRLRRGVEVQGNEEQQQRHSYELRRKRAAPIRDRSHASSGSSDVEVSDDASRLNVRQSSRGRPIRKVRRFEMS
uniref:Bromo domain-containing protein n=1 Tax=Trichuris muris TaxID=70415 RepID=A0A5S6R0B2_TRIMR